MVNECEDVRSFIKGAPRAAVRSCKDCRTALVFRAGRWLIFNKGPFSKNRMARISAVHGGRWRLSNFCLGRSTSKVSFVGYFSNGAFKVLFQITVGPHRFVKYMLHGRVNGLLSSCDPIRLLKRVANFKDFSRKICRL